MVDLAAVAGRLASTETHHDPGDQLNRLRDEAAKRELTLRAALALLVEREIARENARRLEMAGEIAHFPTARDGFDFAAQPSRDARQIRELAA